MQKPGVELYERTYVTVPRSGDSACISDLPSMSKSFRIATVCSGISLPPIWAVSACLVRSILTCSRGVAAECGAGEGQ
jgi:hypothetical protein